MSSSNRFLSVVAALFVSLTTHVPISSAQDIPVVNVRDVLQGEYPNIHIQAVGTIQTNLELILRISATDPDTFDLLIPAGTVFREVGGRSLLSQGKLANPGQAFGALFSSVSRVPGDRPVPPRPNDTGNSSGFTVDLPIYVLCIDALLPAPFVGQAYDVILDSLEYIPRLAKMFEGFEAFQVGMKQVDAKAAAHQALTDEETRSARFIDWIEDEGQSHRPVYWKGGRSVGDLTKSLLPMSERNRSHGNQAAGFFEMRRDVAQNVLWTMVLDDETYSPQKVRDDIDYALPFENQDELDDAAREANAFLEVLGLDRRVLVIDSLIVPIAFDILYPPFFSTAWDGAGAGFAVRLTPPQNSCQWKLMSVSYYLFSDIAGTFRSAIISSSNGIPGVDLTNRKTVSFSPMPDGEIIEVDYSDQNLLISDDFFVALFQTAAEVPTVLLTEAINSRASSFDGVAWAAENFSLFFGAKLRKVNTSPTAPVSLWSQNGEPISANQVLFTWLPATDPDGESVRYRLQFSLLSDFVNLLHEVSAVSETSYPFTSLPAAVSAQMENNATYWRVRAEDPCGAASAFSAAESFTLSNGVITEADSRRDDLPRDFLLHPSYPNPFSQETTLKLDVPRPERVAIQAYNLLGQKVANLVERDFEAGRHIVRWSGKTLDGSALPSGVYLLRMQAGSFTQIRKLTVVR